MGGWGPGIFQNDVSDDVRTLYKSQLKCGKSDEDALSAVMHECRNEIDDDEDKYDVWFALASVMYDHGRLTDTVKDKANELIENSAPDLDRWDKTDRKKRVGEINKLKIKINSPPLERKKVHVTRPFDSGWNKNDVFYLKLGEEYSNTNYYGKYILVLVEDIFVHDARIEGLNDRLPVTLLKLADEIPTETTDIDKAPFIPYYFGYTHKWHLRIMWYSTKFSALKKRLTYLGNFNFGVPSPDERIMPLPETDDQPFIGEFAYRFDEIVLKHLTDGNIFYNVHFRE